jgi:hypothetical protein
MLLINIHNIYYTSKSFFVLFGETKNTDEMCLFLHIQVHSVVSSQTLIV